MLVLLRNYGPVDVEDANVCIERELSDNLLHCFGKDLPPDIAKRALVSFATYIEDEGNLNNLAAFARTYAALAIRNLDPLGRRWQQAAMSRSVLALDTDAVLYLIIAELPEHEMIKSAVIALNSSGFKIVIPEKVVREVVGHISRADRSYYRFKNNLIRMSSSMVDAQVWHAVVRGYYYALKRNDSIGWRSYWSNYYNDKEPERYTRYLIGKIVDVNIEQLEDIPKEWLPDLEIIANDVHESKEIRRLKAEYREDNQMRTRAYEDVRLAMYLASYEKKTAASKARGYIISEDTGFLTAQRHSLWSPRPKVLILTHCLPELAGFVCGTVLDDDQIVRLLFDPALVSAAALLEKEIRSLTALGVDLNTISLGRLEWNLESGLYDALHGYEEISADNIEERLLGAMAVWKSAERINLPLDPTIQHLARSYEESIKRISSKEKEIGDLEETIVRIAQAAGKTKKARRRINHVLKEIGLNVEDIQSDE